MKKYFSCPIYKLKYISNPPEKKSLSEKNKILIEREREGSRENNINIRNLVVYALNQELRV